MGHGWENPGKPEGLGELNCRNQTDDYHDRSLERYRLEMEESRVLDIGAGPGTLAIPFDQKVAHVTAVEPAECMCSVMREKMWWEK